LAYTEFMWQEDWPGAKSEFQRALELDDNDVPAHQWFGLYLAAHGQMGDALDQMQYAKRLDPLSPAAYAALAYTHYLAHNYDQAVHEAETAVRLKPDSMVAHAVLGWSYTEQKKYPAAIEELRTAATLSGNVPIYRCALARAYALSGDPKRAQEILSRVESALDEPRGAGSALAGVYLALGNSRMALHWLEKTAPGDIQANWLRVDPEFDPLRANPRFAAVLARAGKSPE
jgi:tetratricopeptide (TPR) repeat protein